MKKFLVITQNSNIRLVSFDADQDVDFRVNIDKRFTQGAVGVVYDVEFKRLYWSDAGCSPVTKDCTYTNGSINSIFVNGTGLFFGNNHFF